MELFTDPLDVIARVSTTSDSGNSIVHTAHSERAARKHPMSQLDKLEREKAHRETCISETLTHVQPAYTTAYSSAMHDAG
jgi:hypothetical protein